MAKKRTVIIEYRWDKADKWTEYARTQVPSIVSLYQGNCATENRGAEIRTRPLV